MAQTSTPDRVAAVQDLRRSSAASRHVRTDRKGSRAGRKAAAIRDSRAR